MTIRSVVEKWFTKTRLEGNIDTNKSDINTLIKALEDEVRKEIRLCLADNVQSQTLKIGLIGKEAKKVK